MNAQEIIEYIRTSEKKTPVKVYVWEKEPVDFPVGVQRATARRAALSESE